MAENETITRTKVIPAEFDWSGTVFEAWQATCPFCQKTCLGLVVSEEGRLNHIDFLRQGNIKLVCHHFYRATSATYYIFDCIFVFDQNIVNQEGE